MSSTLPILPARPDLRAECSNCFALCCTAFGFAPSTDFAEDKPAGVPCRHLDSEFSCTIHDKLRPRGFRGCTVFDCFGAGQAVSQRVYAGHSWRDRPDTRESMFAVFSVMKQLHEMLWHLSEAQRRTYDPDAEHSAKVVETRILELTHRSPAELLSTDIHALHIEVRSILIEVSAGVRAAYFADTEQLNSRFTPGADLAGADLRANRLHGADLRGTCLIAADLRRTDLAGVDLLGADLRDARLEGADLSAALYVTQPQVNAARGDHNTRLPAALTAPPHWGT